MFRLLRERVLDTLINISLRLAYSLKDVLLSGIPSEEERLEKCRKLVDCLISNGVIEKFFSCIAKNFGRDKALFLAVFIKEVGERLEAKRFVNYMNKLIKDIEYGILE